jgi:hypothetical protein
MRKLPSNIIVIFKSPSFSRKAVFLYSGEILDEEIDGLLETLLAESCFFRTCRHAEEFSTPSILFGYLQRKLETQKSRSSLV